MTSLQLGHHIVLHVNQVLGIRSRRFGPFDRSIALFIECMLARYLYHFYFLVHAVTSYCLVVSLRDLMRVGLRSCAYGLVASLTLDNDWVLMCDCMH